MQRQTPILLALSLLVATAGCGETPGSDDGGASEPEVEAPAERSGSGANAGAETHSHDGEDAHTHGGDSHTHAAADTLDAAVPIAGAGDGSAAGTVTVMARGDTLRVHVSLEGAEPGTRHPARLLAGSCSTPGDFLADLTPVMTGTSGNGSSQTELPPARTAGHAHAAVQIGGAATGSVIGCASVHLAGTHRHGGS